MTKVCKIRRQLDKSKALLQMKSLTYVAKVTTIVMIGSKKLSITLIIQTRKEVKELLTYLRMLTMISDISVLSKE